MRKRTLILRDRETKVRVAAHYLEISNSTNRYIVAFAHLEALYLNKANTLNIGACYAIAQRVPLYLIDENGYIVGKVEVQKGA